MKKSLGIYIHIPFCIKKCKYCDFLSGPAGAETQRNYVRRLKEEMKGYAELLDGRITETIFFGGGTPSILDGKDIEEMLDILRTFGNISENAEISIEANPGTVTEEKLRSWKRAGINRISFGLQSAENEELKNLGRIHTWEEFDVEFIREGAFYGCSALENVSFAEGVEIGDWAFSHTPVTP